MGTKRAHEPDSQDSTVASKIDKVEEDSGSDEDFDMVDVDFEWFNYDPEVDFHGIKSLLRQLFDVDAALFNISELSDLVLSQPLVGSTVKVDGKATDAYAMMTVLNTNIHQEHKALAPVLKYLIEKAQTNDALSAIAHAISGGNHVGLIFSERLINMPAEIGPPLYSMLIDEVEAAVEDKEPYEFSHYLILSKTYKEVASTLNVDDRKKKKAKEDPATYYFHVEDEVFHKHAVAFGNFDYTKEEDSVADSKRAFQEMGVKSAGHMILIEADKFQGAVQAINDYIKAPQ